MIVRITPREMWRCIEVAAERIGNSGESGRNFARSCDRSFKERITQEIVGASAEFAVCKAEGWDWRPVIDTFKDVPDVGGKYDVRATELANGKLIIREDDPSHRWFIFVTGKPPIMTIRGCILAADARLREWARNPGGKRESYFVPQSALRPYVPRDQRIKL